MDSGQVQREVSAESFTHEIDREANAIAGAASQERPAANERVNTEQAQNLGRGAIFGGVETVGGGRDREIAAELEISEDENRERNPEEFVGEESPLQVAEREQKANEMLQNEMGTGLPLEVEITRKGLNGVTQEVAGGVDKLVRQPQYELNDLEELYSAGNRMALNALGYRLGEGN